MRLDGYMPVRIVSGRDCVKNNAALLRRFGDRCLIVTSRTAAKKSGALSDCTGALDAAGISFTVFDRIGENPLTTDCHAAGRLAAEAGAEFVIGIGGGSPMDAAKAVAIYAVNPEMSHIDIYARPIPAKALSVVLIGTTAGTGSEVTGVSVLTNPETGRKKSISGPDCYAAVSFCDAKYTFAAPETVTVSTALDALAHAVESVLCATANELSLCYAYRAIGLLSPFVSSLPRAGEPYSDALRESLYAASLFAGLAINITGTAFPHTVGYYLTETYGVPHGLACAAFMPPLLDRAKKECPEKLGAIEEALGMTADVLVTKIRASLRFDFLISQAEAASAAQRWAGGVKNFDRSPGGFTVADAAQALFALTAARE